jgi:hypothetical protein
MRPPIPKTAIAIVAPIGLERKQSRYEPFDHLSLVGSPYVSAAANLASMHLSGTLPASG